MKGTVFCNTFSTLPALLEPYQSVFVVYDSNVSHIMQSGILPALRQDSGAEAKLRGCLALRLGEENKTLDTAGRICSWLLENGADRAGSIVLAVGGGIATDIVGFAASVYERGIPCAYIPTTLLAQVDAAVGGKTGVNLHSYKNMVGTFTLPVFTFISPQALSGLPERELVCGAAEVLKSFIISDGGWYERAVDYFGSFSAGKTGTDDPELMEIVKAAVAVKTGIVERDFREGGERRKLNLGHTFAHAIEHLSQSEAGNIHHGEAVAMGMVMAARLSEKLGIAPGGLADKIEADLRRAGLPTECPYPLESLKEAMGHDKKAQGDGVHFVLVRAIGDTPVQNLKIADLA